MICNNCGTNNNKENKYCIECGSEIDKQKDQSGNACPECGNANDDKNKFCISCGTQLQSGQKSNKSNQRVNNKNSKKTQQRNRSRRSIKNNQKQPGIFKNYKNLWITVLVIAGSIFIASSFDLIFNDHPETGNNLLEQRSSNPAIESEVFEIASKFVCSCGSCGEESLEVCSCPRAVEERNFIRTYLEQNQNPVDITVAVANKYGWMKSEFASDYNVAPDKIWNPDSKLEVNTDIISNSPGINNNVAQYQDRITIYTAFECPCGQCGIDELKDCTCEHPSGAQEVKSFIDQKINENKYTVNEIIQMVDNKYGGKKI